MTALILCILLSAPNPLAWKVPISPCDTLMVKAWGFRAGEVMMVPFAIVGDACRSHYDVPTIRLRCYGAWHSQQATHLDSPPWGKGKPRATYYLAEYRVRDDQGDFDPAWVDSVEVK